jgi:hypothetical protein
MKRPLGFSDKLRIFIKWMRQHKDFGLVGTCSVCQSTRVRRIDSKDEREGFNVSYTATYECMDCEAMAVAHETWKARPEAVKTTE